MAKEFPLQDVTTDAGQAAEALIIQLLRNEYPNLDLRQGTVLRELLVRPSAALEARETERYDYLQLIRSLQLIAQNPDAATVDDINVLLSVYGLEMRAGSVAQGTVQVTLATTAEFTVASSVVFETVDGVQFNPSATYQAVNTVEDATTQLQIYPALDGTYYYILVPVSAVVAGVSGNIVTGTAFEVTEGTVTGLVTAAAYTPFQDGVDPETVTDLIERLPAAISHRTLDSRASIEAILKSEVGGNFTNLYALGVQGFGDKAQLRDKHNAHGVAMGGKVDIYPRMFTAPNIVTLQKSGTRIAANTYEIKIAASDAPGFYAVRLVSDAESIFAPEFEFGKIQASGGYAFTEQRSSSGINNTFHDILDTQVEVAYTKYQTATLVVSGVPDTQDTHDFKVEVYSNPQLGDIQTFVDDSDYRNLKADYLIRCPLICLVSVRATLYSENPSSVDTDLVRSRIATLVNSKSFTGTLTESEIVAALHEFDITRVNLTEDPLTGFQLYGTVRDASGVEHTLGPSTININDVADGTVLLLPETVVFAAETRNLDFSVKASTSA